jgi:hypothetical protein
LTAWGPQAPNQTEGNQPKAVICIEDAESKLATNAPQSDSERNRKARISAGYRGADSSMKNGPEGPFLYIVFL